MAGPVGITDTTFRDAHQSLLATRLRTDDLTPLAADMDAMGFHSMEVWGGATFDVTTRFLAEDPWERLRTFKELIPNTPLQMLLRGQSLVGYRSYADDVVNTFVERSAENGIDIFRVFDALNDEWNLTAAAEAVVKAGKHLQMTICYSVTETRLGGPIYNLDYFVNKAKRFEAMGADSVVVKDMAGLLSPYDAFELIGALKSELSCPVQLHTHYTSGMASMTVLKAIEAGVDVVDTALSPLALRTSQPAIEPLLVTLMGTDRDPGLDLDALLGLGDRLEAILPKYADLMKTPRAAVIDAKVLSHQIPGGMTSNLISQLREAEALDRLDEVLADITRTRAEMGYPPLVTPMSQMVGSQAVSNVLFGRYKMVSKAVSDYAFGLYGRSPSDMDPEIKAQILQGRTEKGDPPTGRPADDIEPEMAEAKSAVAELTDDIDDVLIYALYPTTGLKFLRIKHGLEDVPDDMKPRTEVTGSEAHKQVPQGTGEQGPARSPDARAFDVYVDGEMFVVEVDPRGNVGAPVQTDSPAPRNGSGVQANEAVLVAPMPGLVLRHLVSEGQTVDEGEQVLVMEAMKMENSLPSPIAGTIRTFPIPAGTRVEKGATLAIVTPD
jgi:pyruvate carboxylase subunit B